MWIVSIFILLSTIELMCRKHHCLPKVPCRISPCCTMLISKHTISLYMYQSSVSSKWIVIHETCHLFASYTTHWSTDLETSKSFSRSSPRITKVIADRRSRKGGLFFLRHDFLQSHSLHHQV